MSWPSRGQWKIWRVSHRILPAMNLTLIPHSNRSNKLGQERANAVNEEVQKLLKAGLNVEVSWLANVSYMAHQSYTLRPIINHLLFADDALMYDIIYSTPSILCDLIYVQRSHDHGIIYSCALNIIFEDHYTYLTLFLMLYGLA